MAILYQYVSTQIIVNLIILILLFIVSNADSSSTWVLNKDCVLLNSTRGTHTLVKNSPQNCFDECGTQTTLIALKDNECECHIEKSVGDLGSVYIHITPCSGDSAMACGCKPLQKYNGQGWTLYQKDFSLLSEPSLNEISENTTGCLAVKFYRGDDMNKHQQFSIEQCNMRLHFLCFADFDRQCKVGDTGDIGQWGLSLCHLGGYRTLTNLSYVRLCGQHNSQLYSYWIEAAESSIAPTTVSLLVSTTYNDSSFAIELSSYDVKISPTPSSIYFTSDIQPPTTDSAVWSTLSESLQSSSLVLFSSESVLFNDSSFAIEWSSSDLKISPTPSSIYFTPDIQPPTTDFVVWSTLSLSESSSFPLLSQSKTIAISTTATSTPVQKSSTTTIKPATEVTVGSDAQTKKSDSDMPMYMAIIAGAALLVAVVVIVAVVFVTHRSQSNMREDLMSIYSLHNGTSIAGGSIFSTGRRPRESVLTDDDIDTALFDRPRVHSGESVSRASWNSDPYPYATPNFSSTIRNHSRTFDSAASCLQCGLPSTGRRTTGNHRYRRNDRSSDSGQEMRSTTGRRYTNRLYGYTGRYASSDIEPYTTSSIRGRNHRTRHSLSVRSRKSQRERRSIWDRRPTTSSATFRNRNVSDDESSDITSLEDVTNEAVIKTSVQVSLDDTDKNIIQASAGGAGSEEKMDIVSNAKNSNDMDKDNPIDDSVSAEIHAEPNEYTMW